eukprot:6197174-Pleurochrysis_carterae.AAC.2
MAEAGIEGSAGWEMKKEGSTHPLAKAKCRAVPHKTELEAIPSLGCPSYAGLQLSLRQSLQPTYSLPRSIAQQHAYAPLRFVAFDVA